MNHEKRGGVVIHETDFVGTIRFLKKEDIPHARSLLTHWVRDSQTRKVLIGEVTEILNAMAVSLDEKNEKIYLVAEKEGKILGVIGMRPPEEKIFPYTKTQKPIELVNAFVHPSSQGKHTHIGTALVSGLINLARSMGYTEIILSSGPRYEKTGWPAWEKLFGKEYQEAQGFFGPNIKARIWRKEI